MDCFQTKGNNKKKSKIKGFNKIKYESVKLEKKKTRKGKKKENKSWSIYISSEYEKLHNKKKSNLLKEKKNFLRWRT